MKLLVKKSTPSIRERNGKFNVIYSYTNEKGERKQKWETYETKAEAKRRKKEIEYKKKMKYFRKMQHLRQKLHLRVTRGNGWNLHAATFTSILIY